MKRGEVTAFLSLIFILLITFTAGLMESASIQMAKNYCRADTDRALESVFAEYQKELLDEYDIFAMEATYESGKYSQEAVTNRLKYFGAGRAEHKIQKIQFLTDQGAKAFCEQITYYMENKYGVGFLSDKVSMTDIWKKQEEKAKEYEQEESESWSDFDGMLSEAEGTLPEEDNPIEGIRQLKKSSLLNLIMPEDVAVSEKSIDLNGVVSSRDRNQGYGDFSEEAKSDSAISDLLFGEYLMEHFSMMTDRENTGTLDYELEYIYGGKGSDRENLEIVAKKLLLMRFASNFVFLQGSSAKKAEAEAMAFTLCTIAALPALEAAAAQVILLAWAYGESIMDLRSLMQGLKVPLVKTEESWQLSISGLMALKETGNLNDGKDSETGLTYKEYLRILLFLKKKETVAMRALDLVEENLRTRHGMEFFRADYCVSRIQLKSTSYLRRGVSYRFYTYFGYN